MNYDTLYKKTGVQFSTYQNVKADLCNLTGVRDPSTEDIIRWAFICANYGFRSHGAALDAMRRENEGPVQLDLMKKLQR